MDRDSSHRSCRAARSERILIKLLSTLTALILVPTVLFAAFGDISVTASARSGSVKVGASAGFGIAQNGSEYTGFAVEYLREIKRHTGDTYEYVGGNVDELAQMMANGEIDIIPCVTEQEFEVWKELLGEAGYDGELYLGEFSLMTKYSAIYVKSDSETSYSDFDSLKSKRIGYLRDNYDMFFPDGQFLSPDLRKSIFVTYNTEAQMQADFDSGKIDAVAKDCFRGWKDDVIVCQMATAECYFMATERSKDTLDDIDAALGAITMADSSFWSNLYEKYASVFGGRRYAYTESEKYYLENSGTITVGVNTQSPMIEKTNNKTVSGSIVETMAQLGEVSGLEIVLVPYDSLKDCIAALKQGEVQAICGGVNYASMEQYSADIRVSSPYSKAPIAAAGKTGTTVGERSKIAIPVSAEDISVYLSEVYPNAQQIRCSNEKECLDAVEIGEADFAYAGAYDLIYALGGDYGNLDIVDVRSTLHTECLAIPSDSMDLANIIGKSLAVMSTNPALVNAYSAIVEKNVKSDSSTLFSTYLVWIVLAVLIVVVVLFVFACRTSFRSHRAEEKDPVTGGRSKKKFYEDTRKLLKKSNPEKWTVALFDIDKFKYVNDRLGYDEGNRMLERLHKTVSDHIDDDEVFARLSDDNFVLTIKDGTDIEIASRLNGIFTEFTRRNNLFVKYQVIFSAGVCRLDQCIHESHKGEVDINAAIDRCKIAKSTLKGTHYSSIAFYDGSIRSRALRERDYENTMPAALERKEFQCYLQPKYGLRTRRIEGAEALIRWNSKDFGFISPGDFIPIAEKNGFVVELDFFILEEVCRTMRRWIDQGLDPVVISVNQSRLHLNYDDYIWRLREIVDKYNIPYEYIELELTESVFTENAEKLLKIMHKLHEIGFKLSLDDFGSGYSSLNMLKDMPVDVVKIDKEFFSDTMNTSKGRAVISTVVDLANNLDMEVISEGVETEEQVEFLTEIHCAMVQGFYFAKPMPIRDFEERWFAELDEVRQQMDAAAESQKQRLSEKEQKQRSTRGTGMPFGEASPAN